MHPTALEVRDAEYEGEHLVILNGEIDLATRQVFAGHLAGLIRDGTRRLVIDFSEVRFMDSSAIGVLLQVRRDLSGEGSSLRLAVSDNLRKIFEMTGLDRHFEFVDSPLQAELDSLRSRLGPSL